MIGVFWIRSGMINCECVFVHVVLCNLNFFLTHFSIGYI